MKHLLRSRRTAGWTALLLVATALTVSSTRSDASPAGRRCPWVGSAASPASKAAEVLARMTLGEKVRLVSGARSAGPAAAVVTGVARLCVPDLVLSDASAGIGNRQTGTTAFPDEIAQTATWDSGLQTAQGRALGAEAVAKGVNVVFGPGANLARNPLNGRGFEYAGEDPLLAGRTAAALIKGIQSQHVIATVKHLALNDQETDRATMSSDADERTAAELYLAPFDAAVQAGVGAAMCAYNQITSAYACQDPALLRGVLRGRFGFTGFTVSDFLATHSTAGSAKAGLDVELPAASYYGDRLAEAVKSHAVTLAMLDGMVTHVLTTMFRVGLVDHPPRGPLATATTASSLSVARQVVEQGSVLLRNTGVLPIAPSVRKVAVIGDAASGAGAQKAIQGYGSAHVPQFGLHDQVADPLASITARAARAGATVSFDSGSNPLTAALKAATADVAVVFVNDVEVEGQDRPDLKPRTGSCSLSGGTTCTYSSVDQDALVAAVAAVNPRTVVVLQTGGPVVMPWVHQVAAVVESWLPGQQVGPALEHLLWGDVDFSGRLPVTFPVALADGPLRTAAQYPGTKGADGILHATYSEGLLIGYRWYDAQAITPLFPFGFGLSYTSFRFSRLRVVPTATGATVEVAVTNTGSRAGSEVAQVYVSAPQVAGEPPKALAGFAKVALSRGQTRVLSIPVAARAFQVWSTGRHAWVSVPGCWGIHVGDSSASLPLSGRRC